MEGFATLLALAALAAAWWFTTNKLKGKNWFLRHLAGSTAGVIALILTMTLFVAMGLVDSETADTPPIAEVAPADADFEGGQPKPAPAPTPVEDTPSEPEPEPIIETEEDDPFGPESQAILDEFTPRMTALVEAGLSMEPLRRSDNLEDLGQCGDMMRQNQAELSSVRSDLSAAFKNLPSGQGAWHPNFEPLHNAEANLIRCVTCVPTALPDCQEAAQALGIQQ